MAELDRAGYQISRPEDRRVLAHLAGVVIVVIVVPDVLPRDPGWRFSSNCSCHVVKSDTCREWVGAAI